MNVWLNGKIMPIQSARVSVMDRGFLYGDGVYETVRVYNRRELKDEVGGGSSMLREHFIFRLKDHMKRLETSARGIQLRIPWTNENLSRGLLRVAQANKKLFSHGGAIRMTLTRGPARILGFDPALARQPTVVMLPQAVKHIPKNLIDQGVRLAWVKLRRNPKVSLDPALKSINNLNNILAKMESMKQGAFEALMTNPAGEVAEGSISNIFWIKKGIVWTPALSCGILAGVTRGALIAMCREMGMVVKEGHGKPKQLLQADEVFLTSTTLEILPVSVVTDDQGRSHKIGSGRAGPWSLAYRKLFRTRIAHEAII